MAVLKNVLFLVNYNLYETKSHFVRKFAEAMIRYGIKVTVLNGQAANHSIETEMLKADITCTFNSVNPFENGRYLFDLLKVPFLALLVDPFIYSLGILKSPYTILSCVDRSDCAALQLQGFNRIFFLPHAIEREIVASREERPYEVVFLGSCNDYESVRQHWLDHQPPEICQVLETAADLVLSNDLLSIFQAIGIAREQYPLPNQLNVDWVQLFRYVDQYTRGYDRVQLIRSIRSSQVHLFGSMDSAVTIFQKGWSYYVGNQPNVTIHEAVAYPQALEVLQKTKICLNSMPFFRAGSHERVFMSLACGALPVTSHSLYWEEQFRYGEELLVYRSGQLDKLDAQVTELLANESRRTEMAAVGRSKVMQYHTWDCRVEQLLQNLPL